MIYLNGSEKEFPGEITLAEFLEKEKYQRDRIAVECNGKIVPKAEYEHVKVADGDVIEVLSFVGGG